MVAKKIASKSEPKFGDIFATLMTITIMVPKGASMEVLEKSFTGIRVGNGGITVVKDAATYNIKQCVNTEYSNEEIFHDQLVIFSKCCKLDENFKSKKYDLYNLPIFVRKDAAK